MTVAAPKKGIATALILYLIGMVILVSLGTWQVERLAWKEKLIATIDANLSAMPMPLTTVLKQTSTIDYEYHPVSFIGRLLDKEPTCVFGRSLAGDIGYYIFQPVSVLGQMTMVNLGWMSEAQLVVPETDPSTGRRTKMNCPEKLDLPPDLSGFIAAYRTSVKPHFGAAAPDQSGRIWFTRDTKAMLQNSGIKEPAPFYLTMKEGVHPAFLADQILVDIPNNHLQYLLTWYSLAIVLTVIFFVWLRQRRRSESPLVKDN